MKKLTPEAVVEIYYNLRNETTRALCDRFGIEPGTIYRIRNGEHLRSPARRGRDGTRHPLQDWVPEALYACWSCSPGYQEQNRRFSIGAFVGCVIEDRWLIDLYDGQPDVFQMIDLAE